MNLFSLLPRVLRTVGTVLGVDVQGIERAVTGELPADKRAELEAALLQHEVELQKLDVEALKALVGEAVAATQSDDKFVRRARPTGLYVAYAITAGLAIAAMLGIALDTGFVATLILPLFGNAAWYTHNRTREKLNGAGA